MTATLTGQNTIEFPTRSGQWRASFWHEATEHPVERGQERPKVPTGHLRGEVTVNGVHFSIDFYVEHSAVLVWNPTGGSDGGGAYESTGDGWHMRRTGYISTHRLDRGGDVSSNAKNKAMSEAVAALNERDLDARVAALHGAITSQDVTISTLRDRVAELQRDIDTALAQRDEYRNALDITAGT